MKKIFLPITAIICLFTIVFQTKAFSQCNDSLVYGAVAPFPATMSKVNYLNEFSQALDSIAARTPNIKYLMPGFENMNSDTTDWIAILNKCDEKGFKVIVTFMDSIWNGGNPYAEQFRPIFNQTSGFFDFESMGEFVSNPTCINHPALYAVFMVDEPWHPNKLPQYSTDTLKMMYSQLKSLASTDFNIFVAFSRMIWTQTWSGQGLGGQGSTNLVQWRDSLCDIAQISTLEFQQNSFWTDKLDSNHTISRNIIQTLTPEIPLWTSVQVFGANLGPAPGYWFPTPTYLTAMLDSITLSKYQNIKPLTGMMFQQWDSPLYGQRTTQFSMGDVTYPGDTTQQNASKDAIDAFNQWVSPCTSTGLFDFNDSEPNITAYPNPFSETITFQLNGYGKGNYLLEVLNIQGQTIYKNKFNEILTLDKTELNVPGLFFYRVTSTNGEITTGKIISIK